MTIFILLASIILFIIAELAIKTIQKSNIFKKDRDFDTIKTLVERSFKDVKINVPAGLFFYRGHTWAEIGNSGEVKIGLTDFAQKVFHKIDKLEIHEVGDRVEQGVDAFTIYQGEKDAMFHSPISGTITSVNKKILSNPSLLKDNSYGSGWIYKIKPENLSEEIQYLRIADEAKNWFRNEMKRLKNFMVLRFTQGTLLENTMADGGLPTDGIIDFLDKPAWDQFKNEFLH